MAELVLNLEGVRIYSEAPGFSAGGELYFTLDGEPFPEAGWYDLVSADFEAWLPSMISFGSKHTDLCCFSFLDGPFEVILLRNREDQVMARFLENKAVVQPDTPVSLAMLLDSAAGCARKMNRILYESGIQGDYLDFLSSHGTALGRLSHNTY